MTTSISLQKNCNTLKRNSKLAPQEHIFISQRYRLAKIVYTWIYEDFSCWAEVCAYICI